MDEYLLRGGVIRNKDEAFVMVTEGRVFVNGQKAVSPAQMVGGHDSIEVRGGREFVGRGAYKLEAALDKFGVEVGEKICADVGSATGGFVEVLLKHGATKVYAIDVGRGKLDIKLREDPRVVAMEGVDVRKLESLPQPVHLATIDVSLISLRQILPTVRRLLSPDGMVVALFKPQYEIEDKSLLKHGILRDEKVRAELVEAFRVWLREHSWQERGFMESPIRGSEGNVEYLFHLQSMKAVIN